MADRVGVLLDTLSHRAKLIRELAAAPAGARWRGRDVAAVLDVSTWTLRQWACGGVARPRVLPVERRRGCQGHLYAVEDVRRALGLDSPGGAAT